MECKDQHGNDQHGNDQHENDPPEPAEGTMIQNVIISVSLDELDGLSGDMLV